MGRPAGRVQGDDPAADHSISGSPAGFKLSSGNASSMHGDAFFAWDNAALGHRVRDCIVQKAKCNTAGTF